MTKTRNKKGAKKNFDGEEAPIKIKVETNVNVTKKCRKFDANSLGKIRLRKCGRDRRGVDSILYSLLTLFLATSALASTVEDEGLRNADYLWSTKDTTVAVF
jgi:hypothetical protein